MNTIERLKKIQSGINRGSVQLSDDYPILTQEWLIREGNPDLFNKAHGKDWLKDKVLPVVANVIRCHVEKWGWLYPTQNMTPLNQIMSNLSAKSHVDVLSGSSSTGTDFLRSIFYSYWNVINGPIEQFNKPGVLEKVLAYRMGLNTSIPYTYVLTNGHSVTCNETFDVSLKTIRRGFVVRKAGVSFFKPMVAAQIYQKFLHNIKKPIVWDPSAGFGARLLGFAAACPAGVYIATEPSTQIYTDLRVLSSAIRTKRPNMSIKIHNHGSEVKFLKSNSVDLVFTSPPYFNTEKYFDEPGQCWRDFPTLDQWNNNYVTPTIEQAAGALRRGGILAINVSTEYVEVFSRTIKNAGLAQEDQLQIKMSRDHFSKKFGSPLDASEPILIYKKK